MKNFYSKKQKGFTILELLIVIFVIGLLVAIVLPPFSKNREIQVLKSGVQDILSSVDQARVETLSSLNLSSYGVHFQSNAVIIFSGTVFSANAATNQTINIVTPASITNVTLNGVSSTSGSFYFKRLTGSPSQTGTVTISTPSYSKIITIYPTGTASSN